VFAAGLGITQHVAGTSTLLLCVIVSSLVSEAFFWTIRAFTVRDVRKTLCCA
jgi:multisubunit Na+/H+ antiporter MnhB subunit